MERILVANGLLCDADHTLGWDAPWRVYILTKNITTLIPFNMRDFITKPALQTRSLSAEDTAPKLRLTVVFHPEHHRIGAWADLSPWPMGGSNAKSSAIVLGRNAPILSDGKPLAEGHVSRSACELQLVNSGGFATLKIRSLGDSVCQFGQDDAQQLVVNEADLVNGVPLRLGHGVVCYLRLIEVLPTDLTALPVQTASEAAFLGASPETMRLRQQLSAVACSDLPVLILGESGVGKEVVANAIHRGSQRANAPLVALNMAGLNESLASSQLFGSTRGAFTGAEKRGGYFRQANGGTLFLDEIGDCAPGVQTLLLRALESGEVQVVGGPVETIDVRCIAATDGDVSRESGFSHALFNRLAGHSIFISPLRKRREDVGPQLLHFLRGALQHVNADAGASVLDASASEPHVAAFWARFFFDALKNDWQGNSRDLHKAAVRCAESNPNPSPDQFIVHSPPIAVGFDEETLEHIMHEHAYEVQAAAQALGVSRSTLRRKVAAHPRLPLVESLDDGTIRSAMAKGGSLRTIALRLKVSERALQGRLRRMEVGGC